MATRERIKVNLFWHILLKNHAIDIVKEQLRCLKSSGLYKRIDKLNLGIAIGDRSLEDKLFSLLEKECENYVRYNYNPNHFEFPTLSQLYDCCKTEYSFYGLYIHTKGVSYPNNEGGKHWLDYMNYYNILKWKDAIRHLDMKYDMYGVKLLTKNDAPAYMLHYSGNFFWFLSDYIATLKPVSRLNWTNRGEAEMWPCSGNPIAGTACQEFVDYNTKGKFKPIKIKSNI
jgi:hypothetical protein